VPSTTPTPVKRGRYDAELLAERLYTAHRQRLLAIAQRNSDSTEDAEEALQDALVLFIEHFDPAGEAPPLAWLTLTLKRRCWALTLLALGYTYREICELTGWSYTKVNRCLAEGRERLREMAAQRDSRPAPSSRPYRSSKALTQSRGGQSPGQP
jgi:DNA-directed RNA polymerase specialized sigma24 family protein